MLTRDRIGALLLLAFSIFYWSRIDDIRLLPFQADAAFTGRTAPEVLAVLGIVLSLVLLLKPGSGAKIEAPGYRWGVAGLICLLMVAYGLTVRPVGFLISTSLFLACGFFILGERRWLVLGGVSVPLVVLFWLLMTQVLSVYISPWPDFLEG